MAGLAASWYHALEPKGLVVWQVLRSSPSGEDRMPTLEELHNWAVSHNAAYDVVRDPENNLPHLQFSIAATTIIIDRHQRIRYQGAPTWQELLDLLQDLLIHEE